MLIFVHDCNIIHRDIKPENILFLPDGNLFLVDFVAAKVFQEKALQQTGTIIGSPEYIAQGYFTLNLLHQEINFLANISSPFNRT